MQLRNVAMIVFACGLGCSGGQKAETPASPVETPADPAESAETSDTESTMLLHWVKATKVRDHVVAGELDAAKKTAMELNSGVESPPEAWAPYVAEMDEHTVALRSAADLDDAAAATAQLGASCGSCHAGNQLNIQMANSVAPPEGDDPQTHMQRHMWAVNAMWEGLVGPSEGRWSDGLGVLAEKPLHGRAAASGHVTEDKLELLGEKIHDLGVRGTGVPPEERAAIFGELVSTCANCHMQNLAGPAQ